LKIGKKKTGFKNGNKMIRFLGFPFAMPRPIFANFEDAFKLKQANRNNGITN
jgi:hypothetical protein